jgi:hypothetical protein
MIRGCLWTVVATATILIGCIVLLVVTGNSPRLW